MFVNKMMKMLLVALAISIGAQFSLNLFVEGFIITLSIIILPVLLYKNRDLNPIWIGCLTAVVSPLIRGMIMILQTGDPKFVLHIVYPDVVFYVTYGVVFYVAYWGRKDPNTTQFLITVFLIFLTPILDASSMIFLKRGKDIYPFFLEFIGALQHIQLLLQIFVSSS